MEGPGLGLTRAAVQLAEDQIARACNTFRLGHLAQEVLGSRGLRFPVLPFISKELRLRRSAFKTTDGRMRIAYVANYHGPSLVKQRPVSSNRSLANTIKLELISKMLRQLSHEVEVISHGEVADRKRGFYPECHEEQPFHPDIPIDYASVLRLRRVEPVWSSLSMLRILRRRHRAAPFDVVIVWNLKLPHLICAHYVVQRLKVPVILQYEDDAFVDIWGKPSRNSFGHHAFARSILQQVSACMGCSPWLLSQTPPHIPKLLLRGVVGADIVNHAAQNDAKRKNWVLFSGTHCQQYGLGALITAWEKAGLSDWELHITGYGEDTPMLRKQAESVPGTRFHGLVSREELVRLMCSAAICMNPHDVSHVPGNLFAFKIVEYLSAGAHVITTRMGPAEKELEQGITYMPDNKPETIAATLRQVIETRQWEQRAAEFARNTYGPATVAKSLDDLIRQVVQRRNGSH